ncbi:MAG: ABC transporter substrate-binding protein [Candidatus Bruticola sp.]
MKRNTEGCEGKAPINNICEFNPNLTSQKSTERPDRLSASSEIRTELRLLPSKLAPSVRPRSNKGLFWLIAFGGVLLLTAFICSLISLRPEVENILSWKRNCLAVAVPCDLNGLDPALSSNAVSMQMLQPAFDNLVEFSEGTIKPCLAQSWSTSPDGLVWTFNLRPNVLFHDGTSLSASVVCSWIKRLMNGNGRYYKFFRINLGGQRPVIAEVKSLGQFQVRFKLNYPCADFLELLAAPPMAVTIADKKALGYGAVLGTGPFQIADYRPGQRLRLQAFQQSWRKQSSFKELVFIILPNSSSRLRELERGAIDVMLTLPLAEVDRLKASDQIVLTESKTLVRLSLMPNFLHRPFNDIRGRLALSYASPKKLFTERFAGKRGSLGRSILSPLSKFALNSCSLNNYAPDKAKRLLSRIYGVENQPEKLIMLYCRDSGSWADMRSSAQFLAAGLETSGFQIELHEADQEEYQRDLSGNYYDICLQAEEVAAADPSLEINLLISDPGDVHDQYNIANYDSQRIWRLLEAARSAQNVADRMNCYQAVQKKLDSDAADFVLCWASVIHAHQQNVRGLEIDRWGIIHFEKAFIL